MLPIVILLAVPHLAVVIFAEPLNEVPFIVLAVVKVFAELAVDTCPASVALTKVDAYVLKFLILASVYAFVPEAFVLYLVHISERA